MAKFLCVLQLIFSLVILQNPALAEDKTPENQAYFTVLSDIPLMPDMTEITDQAFIFDKAEGRVVETVGLLSASSSLSPVKYYGSALGQLGWKPLKTGVFQRNHERLVVKTEKIGQGTLVRFQLSPLSR